MLLSICIATYKRGAFIGETLAALAGQLQPEVEIVVLDGASPDDTMAIVEPFVRNHPSIRYIREPVNSGVDTDYDKAVGHACGRWCWLMTDDDVPAPDAVAKVLAALAEDEPELLVIDAEVRDRMLQRPLRRRRLPFSGRRRYGAGDAEAFLRDCGETLSFIGAVVIRRDLWLARERAPYLGSMFVHVGVIFQAPTLTRITVLGEPLIAIRYGNAMWTPRSFDIWAFKWPGLIWSFDHLSAKSRRHVTARSPWRHLVFSLHFRAMGAYAAAQWREHFAGEGWPRRAALRMIAGFPGALANFAGVLLLTVLGRGGGEAAYDLGFRSVFGNPMSRALVRLNWAAREVLAA